MTTPMLAQVANNLLRYRSFDQTFEVEWIQISEDVVTFWVNDTKAATYEVSHPHYPHKLLKTAQWALERELTTMSDTLLLSIAIESIQSGTEWAVVHNWPHYEELRDFMSCN